MTPWRFSALSWHDVPTRGKVATVSDEYTHDDLTRLIGLDVEIDGEPYVLLGVEACMSNPPKGPYGLLVRHLQAP